MGSLVSSSEKAALHVCAGTAETPAKHTTVMRACVEPVPVGPIPAHQLQAILGKPEMLNYVPGASKEWPPDALKGPAFSIR